MGFTSRLNGERWRGAALDAAANYRGNESKIDGKLNRGAGVEIGEICGMMLNTDGVRTEKTGGTVL